MRNLKHLIASLLAVVLLFNLAACTGSSGTGTTPGGSPTTKENSGGSSNDGSDVGEDPLAGEKPVLKILGMYQAYNYEEQLAHKLLTEITGYETKWFMLPAENADQKLLLDISNGEDYDVLLRMAQSSYSQLSKQNALIELNDLLDDYGPNIKAVVSELAWESVTNENNVINGIPHEDMVATKEDTYGMLTGGIGFRSDLMETLNMDIPTNIEDFTKLLEAAKSELDIAPFVMNKGSSFNAALMAAFGLGGPEWYPVDGTYTHRIKMAGLVDYLAYMQKLYKEGLLDTDMPINTQDNVLEKISSANALAAPLMFWDIPAMVSALATNNPDAEILFATEMSIDADTQPVKYIEKGAKQITTVTKNAKNPEHSINFINIISQTDNFRKIYIGEEGVSYNMEDGKYLPIFEGDDASNFNAYTNSDKFTGPPDPIEAFKMWQARARKTPEMAAAYEQMNARVDEYDVRYTIEAYGKAAPKVQEFNSSLGQQFADSFLKAIVEGTDPASAIEAMQADWDADGGLEMEASMQEFYEANKDYLD